MAKTEPPRFDECLECRFYTFGLKARPQCGECHAGEFFEPDFEEDAPTESEKIRQQNEWRHEED